MMCSKCKKNIAVVFVSRIEGDKTINEGLCLKCAKELGIAPVSDMLKKLGITEEEFESMNNDLMETLEGLDDESEDDLMEIGEPEGSTSTASFLNKLFANLPDNAGQNPLEQLKKSRGKEKTIDKEEKKGKKSKRKFLDGYCINLNKKAIDGELDRIVGRERELKRVVQILNRRTKNNPCLIGEPGVGKTAIAEALAQRIADGDVPYRLKGLEVYLVDLTALVAGTQFRGQFESRIKSLVDEVKREGNIILFVDEVHNLVAAGDSEGAMNAANILKPALSRGDVQMIGATTLVEYRKHIEKDSALERRFQPVTVGEPSIEESVAILEGIKGYYENYHNVTVSSEVVRLAVMMSERYITDRYLPDKAIDLLDEACSEVNLENKELEERNKLEGRYKEIIGELENVENASQVDYERVALLKSEQCKLSEQLENWESIGRPEITHNDLAKVIELWTGIPASNISKPEFDRLAGLEDRLKLRIIGQDNAVKIISLAIKRNRVGLSQKRKPVSMIFAGPTGVGKTELVKQLAADLFDTPDNLIRLDMSEFMEKHSVSRIIGSPPGYVGYDEAGQLTEKIRRKPYSVILFDEIEKAHPDVLNILLQVLDDGKITDAHGKTVNFENTVLIMTTNAGSQKREGIMGFSGSVETLEKERVEKALSEFLRPEFLNRIDEIVIFSSLTKDNFADICSIMLNDLKKAMNQNGITLSWTKDALSWLVDKSFGIKFGARELRRSIQRYIENPIANLIIENYQNPIIGIGIMVESGELKFDIMH